MKKLSTLKFVVLASAAFLMMSHKVQAPPYQQKIILTLTVQEAEMVVRGLGKLPYDESAPVINVILSQAQKQMVQQQAPDSSAKKEIPKSKRN